MCTNLPEFAAQEAALYGLKSQIKKLESYLKGLGPVYLKNNDKADFLSLTGGEPTLHPDFFRLLAYFKKRLPGVSITLLSNGRRFADEDFARRFLKMAGSRLTVAVPLHGASSRVHDKVAGVRGAFRETVCGLENLLAGPEGVFLEIRLVLHRLNIKEFSKILLFLREKFPSGRYRVVVIHYEIEGMSLKNHKSLSLRLSDSAKVVNAAAPLIESFTDLRLYHFPLCLIKSKLRGRCWITLPAEDRIYTKKCDRCKARKECLGLMLEYYKEFGDAELKTL